MTFGIPGGKSIIPVEEQLLNADIPQTPFASGTLFSRIFYASSVPMSVVSLPDGRFVDVNQASADLLGCPREEIIGRQGDEFGFIDPDVQDRIAAALLQTGRVREIPAVIRPRGRAPRDVIISIQTEEWAGQSYALAFYQDLTRHREVEEALLAVEARSRLFFNSMPVPVFVYDLDTLEIIDVNPSTCEHYGYSRDELIGLSLTEIWPPDKRPTYLAAAYGHDWDSPAYIERQHQRRDGTLLDVNVTHYGLMLDGRRARLAVVEDVTEQLAAQTALRRSEEWLHMVADMVTDAIWDYDPVAHRVSYTGGMRSQFGHATSIRDDAPNWWVEHIHPDERHAVLGSLDAAMRGDQSRWQSQYRFRHACGSYAHVLDRGDIFRDDSGRATRVIGAMVDISHQIELREAAARATLAERQRLSRDLHDAVTQSLYSLTLMAEAARRRATTGGIAAIAESVDRLSDLALQSLREMYLLVFELRPAALEHGGLVGALQTRLTAIEARSGIQTRLKADIKHDLPLELQVQLFRVAEEALNNAMKHAAASTLAVAVRSDNQQVVLEVRDDGRGFDPARAAQSAGLGLVSMRERVDNLNGVFEVVSGPGEGTVVRVTLEQRDDKNGQSDSYSDL